MLRKRILLTIVVLSFGLAGCDEFIMGAGAGAAGTETFQSWRENLEAKKAELAAQYAEVMTELETAPDPNAIAAAKARLKAIQDQQLVNQAALLTVTTALELPKKQTTEGRQDVIVSSLIGAAVLGWQALSKRKLNLKYSAMKIGKAKFDQDNPDKAGELYADIGVERTKLGL